MGERIEGSSNLNPQRIQRQFVAAGLAALMVAPLYSGTARAQQANQNPCPQAVPTSEITAGMTGTGVTVAKGRTLESFTYEVLGMLPDALGPGRPLIVVETAGDVVERHGGVFFGMSGSPLYQDGRLLGAIAWGLSWGPSTVIGVTPGEDIVELLDYPMADEQASPRRVQMSSRMRTKIAASTSVRLRQVGTSFVPLRIPFGMSGVSGQGMSSVADVFDKEGLPLVPHAAAAAQPAPAPTQGPAPQPGENLSAVLSYGDITSGGTGTVTLACDDKVIAWGHPFFWEGQTVFGAHAADTLTIIEDELFGTYELATIAEPLGMIDQDRLAGIRGLIQTPPPTIPITSTVTSEDLTRTREGQTTVVESDWVPFLAFYHLYSNVLVVMDEFAGGTSDVSFTITGTTDDGTTWDLTRTNMYASEWGIPFDTAYELEVMLYTLFENPFEEVEFTSVDVTATAREDVNLYTIADVQVSRDGTNYQDRRRIRATPGDTIYVRVMVTPYGEEEQVPVDLSVQIPRRARNYSLIEISGPNVYEDEICFYEPDLCMTGDGEAETLEDLIAQLEEKPQNNELRATLRTGRRGGVAARDSEVLDWVIQGRARVRVILP